MKKYVQILLLLLLLLPALSFAQSRVDAKEIIAKINRGEAVNYKNARIEGNLDFTQLSNKKLKKESDNNNENNTKFYVSTVTAPVSFTNCTFSGHVLGYFNPDNFDLSNDGTVRNLTKSWVGEAKNEVYNTNFEKEVKFLNCTFEQSSNFKYSEFKDGVSFAGSRFGKEAFYKYTKFEKAADFSQAQFENGAVFKYVKFPQQPNFSGVAFAGETDFKYAHFPEGVNFQKTQFKDFANFKYTQFAEPLNLKGAAFKKEGDFKYTQLNGRKVSSAYFLDKAE
ncbi:MAG: pentapeptide repeat-containing protein [Adhaeribacter sp.]